MLTIAQKLNIAAISQYLSANDIYKSGLYGSGIDLNLPNKIYNLRKSIAYWYALDPSDTALEVTSNYLMAICGKYGLEAQNITGGGGSIASIVGAAFPDPYQFTVSGSSFIVNGQSSKTITAFIGYNLLFVRGNITQSTVDIGDGSTYYSWNRETGGFVAIPAAVTGELFQLFAV